MPSWQSPATYLSGSFPVTSVFGRTGAIIATSGDYTASQITNVAAGNISSTNVQAAINELDTEKQPNITGAATTVTSANLATNMALSSDGAGKIIASPTVSSTELGYLDNATSNVQTQLNTLSTTKANLASPALTGTPTAPTPGAGTNTTQIATTAFVRTEVDTAIAGLSWKNAVQAATTGNIALSGLLTIDGYTLLNGDRVLVKDQSTPSQNGIYIASAGAWSRSTDTDTAAEIDQSAVYVKRGTTNATTGWVLATTTTITLGSTNLVYSQFSGNGSYTAGNGITITGNSIAQTNVGTAGTYTKVTTDAMGNVT